MTGLPVPPPSWWGEVPWPAYLAVIVFVACIVTPYGWQWINGRTLSMSSREERIARRESSYANSLEHDVADLKGELAAVRAQLEAVRLDKENGWNRGRGMEAEAHNFRHMAADCAQQFNALLTLFRRFLDGKLTRETVVELLDQQEPVPRLPPVAPLGDVTPREAPRP